MAETKRLLTAALERNNLNAPPVWLMRQAGRYHRHYQALRKAHGFVDLCKKPELAAEVAMGPIEDFDFDAAILFSDILFIIEAMGPDLDFDPGPKFSYHLKSMDDLGKYQVRDDTINHMDFQVEALKRTRELLPDEKALIGFVGGPLTLYIFAVHGTHKTDLTDARAGLEDGRFDGFMERLVPLLARNMVRQAKAGCDAMAMFESCAGDIEFDDFRSRYLPHLEKLLDLFRKDCPDIPLIYQAKGATSAHWALFKKLPITAVGVDPTQDVTEALALLAPEKAVQGNFDPANFTLPPAAFRAEAEGYFFKMKSVPPELLQGWVCGAGDGLTPLAKEENVREFVKMARKFFSSTASQSESAK